MIREELTREEKVQRTRDYLLIFGKIGFPYEECMAMESTLARSREYVNYALRNGFTQEEFTTLFLFHYLRWDDNAWALDFLAKNTVDVVAKPKIKSLK